ncbi:MAG: glycosyltransferase family 1 protein [Conexibacter sp.]|nr:glycosyltransferase family 1 protein [Conexibacter sp.]
MPAALHRFADVVEGYHVPARDPLQERPQLVEPPPWRASLVALRGGLRRRRHGRRLAFVDNMFPWHRSGFRYHEALAIHELLPDTLFFSLWELTDPFPAGVNPLADFPAIAPAAGVTDVYGVFQVFLEGIAGMPPPSWGDPDDPFAGLDLSAVLRRFRMRLHGSIYPGGGFLPTSYGLQRAHELVTHMDTAFSYVPEVLAGVPGVTAVDQAFTETAFYTASIERWERPTPLVCMFAADAPPRKGLDVALATFDELPPDEFHLHVVGPHEGRRGELPEEIATFHGWLGPEELRDLHRRVHVFLSPVRAEEPGPEGSQQGVTDGFPTQAATDALSSGCALVSANPAQDHRILTPDVHYLEREPDPAILRATLRELASDPERARRIAEAGSAQVRERMDVRIGAAQKLQGMGFRIADRGAAGAAARG